MYFKMPGQLDCGESHRHHHDHADQTVLNGPFELSKRAGHSPVCSRDVAHPYLLQLKFGGQGGASGREAKFLADPGGRHA
jgi:hypothetical protein